MYRYEVYYGSTPPMGELEAAYDEGYEVVSIAFGKVPRSYVVTEYNGMPGFYGTEEADGWRVFFKKVRP